MCSASFFSFLTVSVLTMSRARRAQQHWVQLKEVQPIEASK
ncbi:hypothetical protein [Tengunoibacter tsumagoiensis]|nr:hypothetical protein [Tengunoibacter tsumagoiensis]